MSDADTDAGRSDPEMTQINLRISESFLDDLDATWREEGFPNRSDFIRWALRDAVHHPDFTRKSWMQMAETLLRERRGEEERMTAEEARALVERRQMLDRTDDDEFVPLDETEDED